eukprot:TRINITY_DN42152_c0_g1_i1.p1 TRINITY_DN42152_c0_g1~~TRINITY_DN42152_c0_g1_i1.p1  ORF type:complete len:224 (+),score=33.65 TRINITY_DN42152_c0_g1_i1:123-794(+)
MTVNSGTRQRRSIVSRDAMYEIPWVDDGRWHHQGKAWSDCCRIAQSLVGTDESSRAAFIARDEERAWMHPQAAEHPLGISNTRLPAQQPLPRGVARPGSSLLLPRQPASHMTEEVKVKEATIEQLDAAEDVNLFNVLVCVKEHRMVCPKATDRAVEVGQMIPGCVRSWMLDQELRLCRILKCYSRDFYVFEEDDNVYIQCLHKTPRAMFTFLRPTTYGRVVRL